MIDGASDLTKIWNITFWSTVARQTHLGTCLQVTRIMTVTGVLRHTVSVTSSVVPVVIAEGCHSDCYTI